MGQNPSLTAFTSEIQVFFRPECTKGWPHKNEFWPCLNAKVSFLNRAWKADEKNGVISVVFISPFLFMVLKLSKIVSFLQLFADISKKSKALLAIYVYASESSRFALSENGFDYYAMI